MALIALLHQGWPDLLYVPALSDSSIIDCYSDSSTIDCYSDSSMIDCYSDSSMIDFCNSDGPTCPALHPRQKVDGSNSDGSILIATTVIAQ